MPWKYVDANESIDLVDEIADACNLPDTNTLFRSLLLRALKEIRELRKRAGLVKDSKPSELGSALQKAYETKVAIQVGANLRERIEKLLQRTEWDGRNRPADWTNNEEYLVEWQEEAEDVFREILNG